MPPISTTVLLMPGIGTRFPSLMRKHLHLAGVAMIMVLLAGCSSFEIAYSFADDALEARAEKYLDMNAEEEAAMEAEAQALMAWHRKVMLPKYAAFFRHEAKIAEAGGWTRPQWASAFARFRTLVDETTEGAAPFIARVLAAHTTPGKIAHIEARMAENRAERRAEDADETPEEWLDAWVERRADRVARFTGALTVDQIKIIRGYSGTAQENAKLWRANSAKRQAALLTFLRKQPAVNEIARFIHRITLHAHEIVDPAYRKVSEARWKLREDMYFEVLSTLSAEQRAELVATFRSYASDMVDLAGS